MTGSPDPWRNDVVAVEELPAVDDAPFEPVEQRFLTQQRSGWAIGFGALAIAALVVLAVVGAPVWLWVVVLGALATGFLAAWILTGLAFAHRGVQLREHDVSTRRGLIGRRTITVPFSRVQHVTVERGAIERLFNLSTVVIFTAGAIAADARVSGLEPERAERLREGIINRSNLERERADLPVDASDA